MGIVAFIVLGLVVGLVARFIVPAQLKLGLARTCLLGILGALVGGGVLGSAFDRDARPFELAPMDITLAVLLACIAIVLVGVANSRRAHA